MVDRTDFEKQGLGTATPKGGWGDPGGFGHRWSSARLKCPSGHPVGSVGCNLSNGTCIDGTGSERTGQPERQRTRVSLWPASRNPDFGLEEGEDSSRGRQRPWRSRSRHSSNGGQPGPPPIARRASVRSVEGCREGAHWSSDRLRTESGAVRHGRVRRKAWTHRVDGVE